MEQLQIQKTKKQLWHGKITKVSHNFRNIFQRKKEKQSAKITETKIDAWEWFAEFLRTEYKFNTKIIRGTDGAKKRNFIFMFDKAIIINTPNSDFSILITNKGYKDRYISMTYCIGEHIITQETMLMYQLTNKSYTKNDHKPTKYDEEFNNVFGINDFVNCYVANKIIKRIHDCLDPNIFCKYIHNLGILAMEKNNFSDLLSFKHEKQKKTCDCVSCMEDINFSDLSLSNHDERKQCSDYVSCLHNFNEYLKECKEVPYICYNYKICFEALYSTFIKNTFLIKPIRDIVINYLVYSDHTHF
jgi:hypothetical protein